MTQKGLLVSPFNVGEDLLAALEAELGMPIAGEFPPTRKQKSWKIWARHLRYFALAWRAFRQRRRFAVVIFTDQYVALYYVYLLGGIFLAV